MTQLNGADAPRPSRIHIIGPGGDPPAVLAGEGDLFAATEFVSVGTIRGVLVRMTFFPDEVAASKREKEITLADLQNRILEMTADEKEELPFLKLARFGDKKTKNGSLRHDKNLVEITGVEADYDGKKIPFDQAVATLQKAGLMSIAYTSPSHTEAGPKWRILCPTSKPLPPERRRDLLSKLTNLFGDIFAPESKVLSQSYYFGSVRDNPAHRCEALYGTYIDELDDEQHERTDIDKRLAAMEFGTDLHNTQLSVSASMLERGSSIDDIVAKIMDATRAAAERAGEADWDWEREENNVRKMCTDWLDKHPKGVTREDFCAYMPKHNYIYIPTREPWPASSVNAKVPPVPLTNARGEPICDAKGKQIKISASAWLDENRSVEQMTWAPGEPMEIRDRLVADGGWFERRGATVFNLYQPPTIILGDATQAGLWIDHVHKLYPEEADHIIKYFAHRVQRPQEKPNHGLVLGGDQGIGKDCIVVPVKRAVGPWNVSEVSPQQMLGRFNGYVKSVILRISEARDLGEANRFALYEHLKVYLAAPPDVIRCDEKNLREHAVFNVMGIIITSNRKDSFFLPADDRRHFVAWSKLTKGDFTEEYWRTIWRWYDEGGDRHVAAYLAYLDISAFDPKAPPPKTAAFWDIVNLNRAPEDTEFADVIESMGNPDALTIEMILDHMFRTKSNLETEFSVWLRDRKNRRVIPHRLEQCGYVHVQNPSRIDGRWVLGGKKHTVYAKKELAPRDQYRAAAALHAG